MTTLTRVETILNNGDFAHGLTVGMGRMAHSRAHVAVARRLYSDYRVKLGYSGAAPMLTSGAAQQKLGKNKLPSFGLMLTPERGLMRPELADVRSTFKLTGAFNLCPRASRGCAAACLSFSGQSGMPQAQRAQAVRTAFLLAEPFHAGALIGNEIRLALKRHGRINLRLNTTSDIRWERVAPFALRDMAAAGVQLYDYTAWSPADRQQFVAVDYALTYSAKEVSHTSDEYLRGILAAGGTVAMPFTTGKGEKLPETWQGFKVIDGDESDERRNDPAGVVVGLRAKGHLWKRDNSAGFIRQAN